MSTPKLVATDLDGTLVGSDGKVSPRTAQVLLELDDLGVPVVFVTGRPLRWAEDVFEHVGSHGLAIVSNGALVWDVAEEVPRLQRTVSAEEGLAVSALIRAAVPGSAFAVENLDGIGLETTFMERHAIPFEAKRGTLEELFTQPALKVLARHEELAPQDYWDRAEAATGGRMVITWSSSSTLLEMSAPGVTKASTLELLCDDLGIAAADVIAFGDMPNDLPMLAWAGTSYAMADAHPTVVAAATHLAPPHHEDGVARVLAEVFDLGPGTIPP